MQANVILPDLGAAPVVLSVWFADPGDWVYEGDRLVEVLINGATFDVPSPASGRLSTRLVFPDQHLQTGQILGTLEVEAEQSYDQG